MNGAMDSREGQKPAQDAFIEEITALWICSFVFNAIQQGVETAAVATRWAAAKRDALRKIFESKSSEVEPESNNGERDDGVYDEMQLPRARKGPGWVGDEYGGGGCFPCRRAVVSPN